MGLGEGTLVQGRPQWGWGQEPAHVDPQLYLVSAFEVTLCEEDTTYGCPEPAPRTP